MAEKPLDRAISAPLSKTAIQYSPDQYGHSPQFIGHSRLAYLDFGFPTGIKQAEPCPITSTYRLRRMDPKHS